MREKTTIVVGVAFYLRINKKSSSQIKLSRRAAGTRNERSRKKCTRNLPPTTILRCAKSREKISHNLIPQQCKPKHFPATQNAILRIYFGSQRMICQFYTIFSHLVEAEKSEISMFLLQFHSQFHQFVKWNYQAECAKKILLKFLSFSEIKLFKATFKSWVKAGNFHVSRPPLVYEYIVVCCHCHAKQAAE